MCSSEVAEGATKCACGAPVERSAPQSRETVASPTTHHREVLLIGLACIGAALVTFALMMWRGGPSPALAAATAAVAAEHPTPVAVPETSATETWSADNRALWLGNGRGAAFQLLSENKVRTWFGPTQPILVVRCASRKMDAFVYMRSPSRIEPHAEGKTVTVAIDDEPAKTEQWSDSDDRVSLFAPDGAEFARRLLHAQTLRFGYSPHNADDVVAQFHVAGLGKVLEPAARECGWKK